MCVWSSVFQTSLCWKICHIENSGLKDFLNEVINLRLLFWLKFKVISNFTSPRHKPRPHHIKQFVELLVHHYLLTRDVYKTHKPFILTSNKGSRDSSPIHTLNLWRDSVRVMWPKSRPLPDAFYYIKNKM